MANRQRLAGLFFVFGLGLLFGFAWLAADGNMKARAKAKMARTRADECVILLLLGEQAGTTGGLTNLDLQFIPGTLLAAYQNQFEFTTNNAGAVEDIWQTPYKIERFGQANFIIRSAGKDKMFGTRDDIIFNSASNDFVKP